MFLFISFDNPLKSKLAFFSFYFYYYQKQVTLQSNIVLKEKVLKLTSFATLEAVINE